jgi:peptidoglycan-N-acetylglucosamine deacetylase
MRRVAWALMSAMVVASATAYSSQAATASPSRPAAATPSSAGATWASVGAVGLYRASWPGRRQAALTFDDGPSAYTGAVLDVLARKNARATFFVLGSQVGGRRATVARTHRAGHSVQNHTWSHKNLTRLNRYWQLVELKVTSDTIASVTGTRPACFRPPYGATSAGVRSNAASIGLRQVLWNVDTNDYQRPSAATIVRRSLNLADGRPLVILLHDGGGNRSNTVAALPGIIDGLRARGYQIVTLCR